VRQLWIGVGLAQIRSTAGGPIRYSVQTDHRKCSLGGEPSSCLGVPGKELLPFIHFESSPLVAEIRRLTVGSTGLAREFTDAIDWTPVRPTADTCSWGSVADYTFVCLVPSAFRWDKRIPTWQLLRSGVQARTTFECEVGPRPLKENGEVIAESHSACQVPPLHRAQRKTVQLN
jgi:hypothetical protein